MMIHQVTEFMSVMGQHMPELPIIPNNKIVELRVGLINEESKELQDAAIANDLIEVADALCDLQYVLSGAVRSFGFSPMFFQALFDEVHRSNMSKVCSTMEEAELTVIKYTAQNIPTHITAVSEFFVVARDSDKKVLKSINYKKPDLLSIFKKYGCDPTSA